MAEPERNALVVKIRRIVATHTGDAAPYCTRGHKKRKPASELPTPFDSRVRRGGALPNVTLAEPEPGDDYRCRKALAFVVGLEGPGGKRLPSGMFHLVMDMLMVRWDPLRGMPGGEGGGGKKKKPVHCGEDGGGGGGDVGCPVG